MTPGKGCGLDFLRNIDIDSELRRGKIIRNVQKIITEVLTAKKL